METRGAINVGSTRGWDQLMATVQGMIAREPEVRVGVFSDAEKAAAHEFGTDTIPERSFIRLTFQKKEPELVTMTEKVSRAIVAGKITPEQGLGLLGQWAASACQDTIREQPVEWDPRSEPYHSEQVAQGKTKTLIDTGELLASITYEVVR